MPAFCCTSPWEVGGQAADMEIHAREILKIRQQLNEILAACTGRDLAQVQQDTERDFFMSPEAAKEYGLIDEIIAPTVSAVGSEAVGVSS